MDLWGGVFVRTRVPSCIWGQGKKWEGSSVIFFFFFEFESVAEKEFPLPFQVLLEGLRIK